MFGELKLVDLLTSRTSLTKKQSAEAVSTLLECIAETIRQGHSVGLMGVGTLKVQTVTSRVGTQPGTGQRIQIPARRRVSFKVRTYAK